LIPTYSQSGTNLAHLHVGDHLHPVLEGRVQIRCRERTACVRPADHRFDRFVPKRRGGRVQDEDAQTVLGLPRRELGRHQVVFALRLFRPGGDQVERRRLTDLDAGRVGADELDSQIQRLLLQVRWPVACREDILQERCSRLEVVGSQVRARRVQLRDAARIGRLPAIGHIGQLVGCLTVIARTELPEGARQVLIGLSNPRAADGDKAGQDHHRHAEENKRVPVSDGSLSHPVKEPQKPQQPAPHLDS
jgi:hypothetical protein